MSPSCCCVVADAVLAMSLSEELAADDVRICHAASGRDALAMTLEPPVVFAICAPLPDMSPSEFLRRLRERSDEPLALVAGEGLDEIDRIVAFELGADDIVALPAPTRELALRIRALLRRSKPAKLAPDHVVSGRLEVDIPRHLVSVDGVPVDLTAMEFRLLAHLARHADVVLSRARLLAEVWKHPNGLDPRTVDTHVKRLREKLGDASETLETVRGFGYRFKSHPRGDSANTATQASR